MKFTVNSSLLSENLSLVDRCVPTRPTHPVLGNVLIEASGSTVSLTGFDLSTGLRVSFPAGIERSGRYALPSKLLSGIVGKLDGEVSIDVVEGGAGEESVLAHVSTHSAKFQIRGLIADEFPAFPSVEGKPFTIPVASFNVGLCATLFAASSDETKQVLTGVRLTRSIDALEFAATDGHRLAVATMEFEGEKKGDEVTIPARSLSLLMNLLKSPDDAEGTVSTTIDDQTHVAQFEIGEYLLTTRTLDGAYPAYQQLLPKSFKRFVTVDRRSLLKAIDLVAVMSDSKNNLAVFKIGETLIDVRFESQDLGSASQSVDAELTGTAIKIAFNIKYLTESLKAIGSKEIKISYNENTQPAIVEPIAAGDFRITHLIMPVQIRK